MNVGLWRIVIREIMVDELLRWLASSAREPPGWRQQHPCMWSIWKCVAAYRSYCFAEKEKSFSFLLLNCFFCQWEERLRCLQTEENKLTDDSASECFLCSRWADLDCRLAGQCSCLRVQDALHSGWQLIGAIAIVGYRSGPWKFFAVLRSPWKAIESHWKPSTQPELCAFQAVPSRSASK